MVGGAEGEEWGGATDDSGFCIPFPAAHLPRFTNHGSRAKSDDEPWVSCAVRLMLGDH